MFASGLVRQDGAMLRRLLVVLGVVLLAAAGCDAAMVSDAPLEDAGSDVPRLDAPGLDAPGLDAPGFDGGPDSGEVDGGPDTGEVDAPTFDVPGLDAPLLDAPLLDAPTADAPLPSADGGPDAFTFTPSVVSIAPIRIAEGTGGVGGMSTGIITLTVTPASPVDATVQLLTTEMTATSPEDYLVAVSTVMIPRGATSVAARFVMMSDGLDELDETFEAMLSAPTNVTIGTANATVTIADDDTADVTLRYDGPSSVLEGSAAAPGSITFRLDREASPVPTIVGVRLRSGSGPTGAVLGSDFVALFSDTWTLGPGPATGIAFVSTLIGDGIGEPNETFVAEIFSVSGAEFGTPASLTFTILNDDPPQIRGCDTSSVLESAGGRFTFRVTSAIPMTAGVSVGYSYGGTASVTSDYARVSPTASVGSVPFPAGATELTFTIDVRDDVTAEPTETVLLTLLSASGGATIDGACTVSTLSIEDDD